MENNGENPSMVCTVHSCFEYIYKKNRLFGKKRATTRVKHIHSKENNHILPFPTSHFRSVNPASWKPIGH